jgi:ATP-dependent Clp protease ATP-binding subunit ClpA
MIRKALADELLFGKLVTGGKVVVDLDEGDQIKLTFSEADPEPPEAPESEQRAEA